MPLHLRHLLLTWTLAPGVLSAAPEVHLWKDKPPGDLPAVKEGAAPTGRMNDDERMTDVAAPTLTWFRPEKPDGRALVVCPGGGYQILAIHKEGDKVAERFAKEGITVAVLHYRVPAKNTDAADAGPRQDIAEALRQVRAEMKSKGFASGKTGVLGFSAGGHLVLESAYGPMPSGAERPDFVVAIYPAYLTDKAGVLKPEFAITKESPPACFFHAADDKYPADASAQLWRKLHDAGVKAELHIYSGGGHGFGISEPNPDKPWTLWPDTAASWMQGMRK
ncbi:alpha/beta hydrolase [Luteolibacter ambystomatis]|uniref:Alpha/beta hydrolase n=1 Tax=Luteolibacter ambystomatis TaxID=2824561 RepID=A0A975G8W5_9BACT|nr:alpha/beta hydrolase [Luteolibacter ambystomatis]QUE51123.1 alpha/beta hydrolase [Luteolibacter ambystomatis]